MIRPTKFEIDQTASGSSVTLSIIGELDMGTAAQVSDQVAHHLSSKATELTLDLQQLSFMDSSGLRVLIDLHDRSRREGWSLRLIAPEHEAAALVIRTTGAESALPFAKAADP